MSITEKVFEGYKTRLKAYAKHERGDFAELLTHIQDETKRAHNTIWALYIYDMVTLEAVNYMDDAIEDYKRMFIEQILDEREGK